MTILNNPLIIDGVDCGIPYLEELIMETHQFLSFILDRT